MSNSPLEVMRAIVENGGPIEAWVKKDHEDTWERRTIIGVDTASDDLNYMVSGGTYSEWYQFCSLTDPTKKQTRPMTAREFARFVGENMGRYLYRHKNWINHVRWESDPLVSDDINLYYWLYAENVEGELDWKELPEVSE